MCVCVCVCVYNGYCFCCLVAKSCLTLWDPMGYSPPGSTAHEFSQARIPEWVAMPSSRGSSQPRDWTHVSWIAGGFFTIWATREALWNFSYLSFFIFFLVNLTEDFPFHWSFKDPTFGFIDSFIVFVSFILPALDLVCSFKKVS